MGQRVRHYYHGRGTILDSRGAETLVWFDTGESEWVYTITLVPVADEEEIAEPPTPPAPPEIQTTPPPPPGEASQLESTREEQSRVNEGGPPPEIQTTPPPPPGEASPLESTREEQSRVDEGGPPPEIQTTPPPPPGEASQLESTREEQSRVNERSDPGKKRRRIPLQIEERTRKDAYLTMIVLIIGIIFISALIITTSPEPPEESPVTPVYGTVNQSRPAVWTMLEDYFGRSVIVINTTPDLPPKEPENVTEPVIEYDDEIFIQTITAGAIPLTIISMHTIIAIDQSNARILAQNVESLQKIAGENFASVSKMRVSREQSERKEDFQHAMLEFIAVSSYLRRGLPASDNERREALNILSTGTERLDAALRDIDLNLEDLAERDLYAVELSKLSGPAKPDDLLAQGTPFIYRDATQSNEISIYPRYARQHTSFWYESETGTERRNAGEGKAFIAVLIQTTHRGNLDGRRYTIQTPQPSAFTLHGGGETFTPVQTVAHTSLGDMYRPMTLDRRESRQSFIVFEVPYSLRPADTHLSINLGSTLGTPAWDLGERS